MSDLLDLEMYDIMLLVAGIIVLIAGFLPRLLHKRYITAPIFYMIISVIVFGLILDVSDFHFSRETYLIKRVTELGVIVSLTAVGLKINRPFSWNTWKVSTRLLIITMPLTILLMGLLGWWFLGFLPATAVLLGAVLAPTDPVLAEHVQTTPPQYEDECDTRIALTTEAGLNDGLAFPFTNMAIAIAFAGAAPSVWFIDWLVFDLFYKIAAGCLVGLLMGWLLAKLIFSLPISKLPNASKGIIALSLTLVPYGTTELMGGYGFIAVFAAACAFRYQEMAHEYIPILHDFSEELEEILVVAIFVILGIYLTSDFLNDFRWYMIPVALVFLFLIRPITGFAGMIDQRVSWRKKLIISFFGIRGIGSLYYLMFAMHHADFERAGEVLALVTLVIVLSVLIHGILAKPAMKWIEDRET